MGYTRQIAYAYIMITHRMPLILNDDNTGCHIVAATAYRARGITTFYS